jgi:hypothetical protein
VQVDAADINQSANIVAKQKELLEIDKLNADIQQNFIAALFNTKSALAEWANRYILVASETGTLQFASYFQENSWIKTGQELFYIIPKATHLFCRADCIPTEFWQIKARSTGKYCT